MRPTYPRRKVCIAILMYNALDRMQQCSESWFAQGVPVIGLDNACDRMTTNWIRTLPFSHLMRVEVNVGCPGGRNLLMDYCKDRFEFVLQSDNDVRFDPGIIPSMLAVAEHRSDCGFVAWPQSNQGFPVNPDGSVEQVANECLLNRSDAWLDIGKYPESLHVYSSDSWASTMANMLGWKTYLVQESRRGYYHFKHGSQSNKEVPEDCQRDVRHWQEKEACMIRYWKKRLGVQ